MPYSREYPQLITMNSYIHYLQTINIKVVFKGENTGLLLWKVIQKKQKEDETKR